MNTPGSSPRAGTFGARSDEDAEMWCDRCKRRHGVVWFAPSDLWNGVMRESTRGNPDEFSFCCPTCFIQLADERGVGCGMWVVAADPGGGPYPTMESLFGRVPEPIDREHRLLEAHREEFLHEMRQQFPDDNAEECLRDFEAGALVDE